MVTSLNTSNGLCMSFEIPSKLHLMFLHVFAFYSSELPTNNMREENLHFSIHLFMSILVAIVIIQVLITFLITFSDHYAKGNHQKICSPSSKGGVVGIRNHQRHNYQISQDETQTQSLEALSSKAINPTACYPWTLILILTPHQENLKFLNSP